MGGIAQMARFRQPGPAAMMFMNTLAATEARFRARARIARRPCRASATPRQAKTSAAASGIAASSAAITARWRVASTIRYWAVKLTAAAAAASTHRPAAALRSHRPERSWPGPAHPRRVPAAWPPSRTLAAAGAGGLVRVSRRQGVMGQSPGLWAVQRGMLGAWLLSWRDHFFSAGETNGVGVAGNAAGGISGAGR